MTRAVGAVVLVAVSAVVGTGLPPRGAVASTPVEAPLAARTGQWGVELRAPPSSRWGLARGRTVRGVLRQALLDGRIDRRAYGLYVWTDRRARRAVRLLGGARRAEMAAAVGVVDALARRGLLTATRMPAAFLTLQRNLAVWLVYPFPRPGRRFRFADDPAVFEYFPGRGVVFHPLASFGRMNALARICLASRHEDKPGRHARDQATRCRPRPLRRGLDRLVGLATRRGGFTTWEYLVAFGGGAPPWISAMAQATAIQALARGAKALAEPRWLSVAERALGAFVRETPTGVRVPTRHGSHYAMYSFAPRLHVLNGFLQSLVGLHDMAALSGSSRARRLFEAGERVARKAVAAYDTGAWSLYAREGRESPLGYHRLVRTLLTGLCERLGRTEYCAHSHRFARYLREPPRIELTWRKRTRAGRVTPIVFSASKVCSIRISVIGRAGIVLSRNMRVARGRHSVPWTPRKPGRYRLRLVATGPAANETVQRATTRVVETLRG